MQLSTRLTSAAIAALTMTTVGLAGAAAPAGAASSSVPGCRGSDLRIALTPGSGGDDHDHFVIEYKNESGRTCSLRGYPGVDAVTSHGHVLRHAKRTPTGYFGGASQGVQTVNLATGGRASAIVDFLDSDHAGNVCTFAHHIATAPPNTDRVAHRTHELSLCYLRVHPVVAGTTGTD